MAHASLLGTNGHHFTFTSGMISGQINVFIVSRIYTHIHAYRHTLALAHRVMR